MCFEEFVFFCSQNQRSALPAGVMGWETLRKIYSIPRRAHSGCEGIRARERRRRGDCEKDEGGLDVHMYQRDAKRQHSLCISLPCASNIRPFILAECQDQAGMHLSVVPARSINAASRERGNLFKSVKGTSKVRVDTQTVSHLVHRWQPTSDGVVHCS